MSKAGETAMIVLLGFIAGGVFGIASKLAEIIILLKAHHP